METTRSGEFSVKFAYKDLTKDSKRDLSCWSKLWTIKVPQRCKVYAWLMLHDSLLTHEELFRRIVNPKLIFHIVLIISCNFWKLLHQALPSGDIFNKHDLHVHVLCPFGCDCIETTTLSTKPFSLGGVSYMNYTTPMWSNKIHV